MFEMESREFAGVAGEGRRVVCGGPTRLFI